MILKNVNRKFTTSTRITKYFDVGMLHFQLIIIRPEPVSVAEPEPPIFLGTSQSHPPKVRLQLQLSHKKFCYKN